MTQGELSNARMVLTVVRTCESQSKDVIDEWQNHWGIVRWWDQPAQPEGYWNFCGPSAIAQKALLVELYGLIDDVFSLYAPFPGPLAKESIHGLLLDIIPDLLESLWDRATHDSTLPVRRSIREQRPLDAFCGMLVDKLVKSGAEFESAAKTAEIRKMIGTASAPARRLMHKLFVAAPAKPAEEAADAEELVDITAIEANNNGSAKDPFATRPLRDVAIKLAGGSGDELAKRIGVDYRDLRAWLRDRGQRFTKDGGKSSAKTKRIESYLKETQKC